MYKMQIFINYILIILTIYKKNKKKNKVDFVLAIKSLKQLVSLKKTITYLTGCSNFENM